MIPYSSKIISHEYAQHLIHHGWRAADLHVHSNCSFDIRNNPRLSPKKLYEKSMREGIDFISFTDHDTIGAYVQLDCNLPGLVYGVEIEVDDTYTIGHKLHMNVYDIDQLHFDSLMRIAKQGNTFDVVRYCQQRGLPYSYSHPINTAPWERLNVEGICDLMWNFPVLEYNMNLIPEMNDLTIRIAEALGKGVMTATDSHWGEIGKCYTLAKGDTFREFFDNVAQGDAYLVVKDLDERGVNRLLLSYLQAHASGEAAKRGEYSSGFELVDKLLKRSRKGANPAVRLPILIILSAIASSRTMARKYLQAERQKVERIKQELQKIPELRDRI